MLLIIKIGKVEIKLLYHVKFITTQKFNKLTAKIFSARVKQANSVSKTDFDNKLISFNRKITSNKTKYLEFHKMLNTLIRKDDNIFSGRINFTSNDGPQNLFVYQPIFLNQHFLSTHLFINTWCVRIKKKKTKVLIRFLVGNYREYIILNLSHYILLSSIA